MAADMPSRICWERDAFEPRSSRMSIIALWYTHSFDSGAFFWTGGDRSHLAAGRGFFALASSEPFEHRDDIEHRSMMANMMSARQRSPVERVVPTVQALR